MNITKALKTKLTSLGLCKDTDSNEVVLKACVDGMLAGKVTSQEVDELGKTQDSAQDILEQTIMNVMKKFQGANAQPTATPEPVAPANTGTEFQQAFTKLFDVKLDPRLENATASAQSFKDAAVSTEPVAGSVRVKGFGERFDMTRKDLYCPERTKSGTKHALSGQPAMFGNIQLKSTSEYGYAQAAAWFKFCLLSNTTHKNEIPHNLRMTEMDKKLVEYAIHENEFTGWLRDGFEDDRPHQIPVSRRKLTEFERKALLDDSTSGGIEIAPIEFDDALVTIPVLNGELFPLVNVVNVARGRRMKGGSVGNPTFSSTAEGTAMTPFDTTGLVSAFDTTIHPATGSMEIGLDFEDDSPTDIGKIIINKFGEKSLEWLDRVVAVGNGTTEPQGVMVSSTVTVVPSDNDTSGPPTVSDYEGLMFAVQKQYRNTKGSKNVYIGNETSYRRARAIAVGPSDERRVFGMTHGDYMIFDTPYKINHNIGNSQIAYANLGYYRMYRRLGLNVRLETAGNYLAIRHQRLIVVRMRYGGQLELGGAAAYMSDAQS